MSFKKTKNGPVFWEDSKPAHAEYFIDSLIKNSDEAKQTVTLPDAVQKQLDNLMQSTLQGGNRLAGSNERLNKSLFSIAKKGIQPVDIILPVYGNLHVVDDCIKTVLERTNWPYRLTIVDDKSPVDTRKYFDHIIKALPKDTQILYNNKNKGFSATVNRGINNTSNNYICVLNSDVLVTEGWLTKMVFALEADERNKIVNPVTNNTALINVPMQEGYSYLDMNRGLEMTSSHRYPEVMPTGFCFMFNRNIIPEIGQFNEGFESYGEETDYWMRVVSHVVDGVYPRWRAVLADDTYIFHERGTSFSSLGSEKHMAKRQAGAARFHEIWPSFRQYQKGFDVEKAVGPLKTILPPKTESENYNVVFATFSASPCGGMSVITSLVNEYIERGINAQVALIRRETEEGKDPNIVGDLRTQPIMFDSVGDFIENFDKKCFDNGIVIAATAELVDFVTALCKNNTSLISALFAQSYDPAISGDKETKKKMEKAYTKPDFIITGSSWVDKKIKSLGANTLGHINPGIDKRLFIAGDRNQGDERPTLLLSLLQSYPYKGYDRGVTLAKELLKICHRNSKEIRVMAYGVVNVPDVPNLIGLGFISQSQLANILSKEVDIFVDPSHIHSYGLPSLEALACGVVPVCWDNQGIREYVKDNEAVIFDNGTSVSLVANKIYKLLFEENDELEKIKEAGKLINHTREKAVDSFISILEKAADLSSEKKKISVITPHLRKHGGPTTIIHLANLLKRKGHDVMIYTIYPDINPEVIEYSNVPVNVDWKSIDPCDILISNSDNPQNPFFISQPQVAKKIMLKLSHNPRFFDLENDNLKLGWDHIVTSTEWLAEACRNPKTDQGWNHPEQPASRIGWYHYGHNNFNCPPTARKYGSLHSKIRIGFLAHQHPLKGTQEALTALSFIKEKYGDKVEIIGFGEWPEFKKHSPTWCGYAFNASRNQMAKVFQTLDIWLSASHTEGLGRMALEAMSAGVAVVMTDTTAEFAEEDKNCLVVGRGNTGQMTKAVDNLINDQILFTEIVKSGYETACKYADPTEFINSLNKVINSV
jgi:glycosyltransferase involved in cell wall biosynthesis/GT2 family glycosyltransferase